MATGAKRAPGSPLGSPSNSRRPHQALGYKTPMSVWRLGTTGALDEKAVDMTLRLDNAGALPTCPQLQQQQASAA